MTQLIDAKVADIALILRIRQKDQAALTELYEQYSRAVFNMALRVLQNRQLAEEILQDIFVQLWNDPDTWNPDRGNLGGWLLAITRNAAIDRLRKERRQEPLTTAEHVEVPTRARFDEPDWEDRQILRKLLGQLPAEQRQAIFLAYFRGMTHDEIADHLDLPLGTVKSRIRLGLGRLREAWKAADRSIEIL